MFVRLIKGTQNWATSAPVKTHWDTVDHMLGFPSTLHKQQQQQKCDRTSHDN